jgi:hypothetical protein
MSWFDYYGFWPWNADEEDDEEFDDEGARC